MTAVAAAAVARAARRRPARATLRRAGPLHLRLPDRSSRWRRSSRSTGRSSSPRTTTGRVATYPPRAHARRPAAGTTSARLFNSTRSTSTSGRRWSTRPIVAARRHASPWSSSRAGRLRLREAAVPRPQRAAAGRDRRTMIVPTQLGVIPLYILMVQVRLDRPPAGGDRAVPGHRLRRLLDAPVHRRGGAERADRGRPRRRLPHAPDLLARRPARGAARPPPCSACSRS